MPTKRTRTVKEAPPVEADDFKPIKGINTMIENRLHSAGIVTYEQLAALTPVEIAKRVGKLMGVNAERIKEQNWAGQARELVAQTGSAELENVGFVLDLFLDAGKHVTSTQVLNVKSGEGDTWQGWDEDRLLTFFVAQSNLKRPARPATALRLEAAEVKTKVEPKALVSKAMPTSPPVAAPIQVKPSAPTKAVPPTQEATPSPQPQASAVAPATVAEPILRELHVVSPETLTPTALVKSGAPYQVWLELNLSDHLKQKTNPLSYTASVYAERWEDQSHFIVGEARGRITATDEKIDIAGEQLRLQPGVYNLTASLLVMEAEQSGRQHPVAHSSLAKRFVHVS